MLYIVEKGIRWICHTIHHYAKASNSKYWDGNNLYRWAMSQKLPVNNFKWIEETQFKEEFTKIIIKKVMKDIFLKLMFNTPKIYMNFVMIYHFYQKEWRLKK